ncbi:MAG TPA: vWA domain-containing protein, partial [Polyangiales bacterium]
ADGPSTSVGGVTGTPGGAAQPGGGGVAAGANTGLGGTGSVPGGPGGVGGAAVPGGTGTVGGGAGGVPGACSTKVVNAYGLVPDMLIVQDRSLSMQMGQRWEPSKQAVKTITTEFEGLVSFGLEYFPGGDGGLGNIGGLGGAVGGLIGGLLGGGATMGAGGNMGGLPPTMCGGMEKLDVPLMLRNAGAIAASLDATMPNGFTPTGPALDLALKTLGDRNQSVDATVKPAYVLLVTDGDPRCGVAEDPGQQEAARVAVRALKAANIPTYVFGFQIDPNYANLMNELATLGGSMRYYPVENRDQIVAAFREITKDVIKCTFNLDQVPENPRKVRVTIDGNTIPINVEDGWVIDGASVTLQGAACSTLKDGRGHTLSAQIECTEIVLE